MDILFISPTFSGAGGIGPHAYRVAEKLRENGFDVELMDVPHVPIKILKNLSFSMFGTLKALSNKKKYDVVHAWNLPSAFIMKKINARKKILSIHGVYSQQIGMLHSKITTKLVSTNEEKVLSWADVLTTDSKYVMQGITEWIKNWKTRGWLTSSKKPVLNKDLCKRLDELSSSHSIDWKWVKGHSGHRENEIADQLANKGIDEI